MLQRRKRPRLNFPFREGAGVLDFFLFFNQAQDLAFNLFNLHRLVSLGSIHASLYAPKPLGHRWFYFLR